MNVRLDEDFHLFAAVRAGDEEVRFHPSSVTEAPCLLFSMLAGPHPRSRSGRRR
jgi:hypothetical protein